MQLGIVSILCLSFCFLGSRSGISAEQTEPEDRFFGKIYHTQTNDFVNPRQFIQQLSRMQIVVLGEMHDNRYHHDNQAYIVRSLTKTQRVSVGLEFVAWDDQDLFDQYQSNQMTEEDFLKAIKWGGFTFDFYSPLVRLANKSGGTAYGINAPKWVTRKIAKNGIDSLSETEKSSYLPPDFQLGSALYYDRFKSTMSGVGHEMPETILQNYFAAQSTWDETMAFQSLNRFQQGKSDVFVVIVGNFHAEHKLGLPARILVRKNQVGVEQAVVVQVHLPQIDPESIAPYIQMHEKYGALADYIIFTKDGGMPKTEAVVSVRGVENAFLQNLMAE